MAVPTIGRQSVEINIEIEQGTTLRVPLEFRMGKPTSVTGEKVPPIVDVTGMSGQLTIRGDGVDPADDSILTTQNGGVLIGGVDGLVTLVLDHTLTSAFVWDKATYAVELTQSNGDILPFIHGRMKLFDRLT